MSHYSAEQWMKLLTGELEPGTEIDLPVLTGSMCPLICPGDRVKIMRALWNNCHIGDIIIFKKGNQLIAHRLLLRFSIGIIQIFFQKGDFSKKGCFIKTDQIVGKVIHVVKRDGSVHEYGNNRKDERTIAVKKLILSLSAAVVSYGKELIKWIFIHP